MRAFRENDGGFSLIEAVVALVVAVVLFVLLGAALSTSFASSRQTRIRQEATALAGQYVELARSVGWDELAMDAAEIGDPRVSGGQLLADAAGTPANETLHIDPAGLIDGRFTETIDSTTYTIWQYVTVLSSDLRRVVVFVDWVDNNATHSHHTSTVITGRRES